MKKNNHLFTGDSLGTSSQTPLPIQPSGGRWRPVVGLAVFCAGACIAAAPVKDYPYQPVPFTAVKVQNEFWTSRFETNRRVTVWYDFQKCEETGRIDNFAKAAGLMKGEFKGIPFDDSDVYKVIEGASYVLAMQPDPKLDKYLDELIAKIAAAQEPDGYLYTARRLFPPEKMPGMSGKERWSNLGASHELYNVGHLYEAAVAHFQATGKRSLLDVAIKNADLLVREFGPGKRGYPPGHPETEIGLVKLYRATGNTAYLDLAKFFVYVHGRPETHKLYGDYAQDHLPIEEQQEAVGHAVRAGYFYSGVADVAAITGDSKYMAAIDRIWTNMVSKKMHLTGGIGARPGGEAFGADYELPNKTAYLETCAAIANALWNHRMFLLHGDAQYVDVLERVIYNGFLSGVSLSGDRFFYPNPLEADGKTRFNHGSTERQAWFGCSCCPVNVVRFIPSIAGYIYATRQNEIFVNLYIGGQANINLGNRQIKLTQQTRYPWDGNIRLTVDPQSAGEFVLNLRIPGWARGQPMPGGLYSYLDAKTEPPRLSINGRPVSISMNKGFARIQRKWKKGDQVELVLPMVPRRVVAREEVKDDQGRVAIERGPVVYCAEAVDNGGHVLNMVLADDVQLKVEHHPELLGGVTVLKGIAAAATRDEQGMPILKPAAITLIPYAVWDHRGAGEMAVWLARSIEKAAIPPKPTVASTAKLSASHAWQNDSLTALNDQVEPKNSIDHSIPRFTWWDHKGTTEWVQYDFDKPTRVSGVEVYWFDDTGRGQCRLPESWRVLYRAGDSWKAVDTNSPYEVRPNVFNKVSFSPIETTALRLEVKLKPGFSGGILEWRVLQ